MSNIIFKKLTIQETKEIQGGKHVHVDGNSSIANSNRGGERLEGPLPIDHGVCG